MCPLPLREKATQEFAGKHAGPVVKALSAVRVSDAIVSND